MGKMIVGVLVGWLLLGIGAYLFISLGLFNVAATAPADIFDRVAPWALDRSVEKRSAGVDVRIASDDATLARGMSHYRENCLPCHGAPGVKEAEFSEGLNPMVPGMDSPAVQHLTDGQIFWVVKNGIRMTAMPGFGESHSDDEIKDIVAFVRHVPKLTAAEKESLRPAETESHPHHEHH